MGGGFPCRFLFRWSEERQDLEGASFLRIGLWVVERDGWVYRLLGAECEKYCVQVITAGTYGVLYQLLYNYGKSKRFAASALIACWTCARFTLEESCVGAIAENLRRISEPQLLENSSRTEDRDPTDLFEVEAFLTRLTDTHLEAFEAREIPIGFLWSRWMTSSGICAGSFRTCSALLKITKDFLPLNRAASLMLR